uniref:hypothetical protein n=1 Tax=Streptomyces chartreusis TaxID=1969 RepID=UPI003F490ED1
MSPPRQCVRTSGDPHPSDRQPSVRSRSFERNGTRGIDAERDAAASGNGEPGAAGASNTSTNGRRAGSAGFRGELLRSDGLAALDAIDWATLGHAYGSAKDVPGMLRDLHRPERAAGAAGDLLV